MTLWIILTLMIALAACGLTIALVRRYDANRVRGTSQDVLMAQLADVDAQSAAVVLPDSEAEGLRVEIKRRILAEARVAPVAARPLPAWMMPSLALGLVAILTLAAVGLYAMLGHPELSAMPARTATPASAPVTADGAQSADAQHPMGDVASMIAGLENKLKQTPNDPQGWQMLGWSYSRTGRPADAVNAYSRAVALDPKNNEYLSALGEAMAEADGQVSPKAAAIFRRALAVDPTDPRARYFLTMFKDQQGDHAGAMADWIAQIKSAPPDAPWLGEVRSYVESRAKEEGMDISARLPPPANPPITSPSVSSSASPGPTEADVAAASKMSPGDQQAMIHAMVDKLAAQLKVNPRDSDGWIRLMRARMVLGEKDLAVAAYNDARKAFVDAPAQQSALHDAARSLSISD